MQRPLVPSAAHRQRGIGTLLVAVVLLLLVMVLIATVSRTMVVEQRMSANQVRARQAHEAAQAGIDAAMTRLTQGGADQNNNNIADTAPADGSATALVYNKLGTGASYRVAFCDPTSSANISCNPATTASGGTDPAPTCDDLDDEINADGVRERTFLNTPLIVACGWSDDAIGQKMIRQNVGAVPALANPPTMPITARGSINVAGAVTVDNLFNNLTIWSGEQIINIGAVGRTAVLNPACAALDPIAPLPALNDPCLMDVSRGVVIGPDVIADDLSLRDANLSDLQMFSNFTGSESLEVYRATVVDPLYDITAAQTNTLANVLGKAIVVTGNSVTLPNGTIGSRERPVVLIINGNWTGGNVTVFGAIYVTGDLILAGNPVVQGAILVAGNVGGIGNLTVRFDPLTLKNAADRTGRPGLIPGSWRDWN